MNAASTTRVPVDVWQDNLPRCRYCGTPMEPAVLGDSTTEMPALHCSTCRRFEGTDIETLIFVAVQHRKGHLRELLEVMRR